jgi:hypothetical protein
MRRSEMKEHIVVFDQPPQFGKGIPEYYNLKILDVPKDKKDRIIGLLKHLSFMGIKGEFVDRQLYEYRGTRGIERDYCIYAQYHTRSTRVEYNNFCEKKETIELEIDELRVTS